MLILIEGLDGTGKTTIARRLRDENGFELIHKGPPTRPPYEEYTADLCDYEPGEGRNIVCDRWHLGELVYPLARHRSTDMTPDIFDQIDRFLVCKGAFLIYATASLEVIERNLLKRGEPYEAKQVAIERMMFKRAIERTLMTRQTIWLDQTLDEGYLDLTDILDEADWLEGLCISR